MGGHARHVAREDKRRPERRCIVTGAVKQKDELLRFAVAPDCRIVPDVEGRLPGRGFWLSADRDMLKKACSRNLFAKTARAKVTVPGDLVEQVEGLLVRRCLNLIGLARRAGQAVIGYERVREWLRAGRAGILLTASDASRGGRAKLQALAKGIPTVGVLTGDELGNAAGRTRAVHVAVAPGKLAERLLIDAARLAGYRRDSGRELNIGVSE